jgi:hypothetical protein
LNAKIAALGIALACSSISIGDANAIGFCLGGGGGHVAYRADGSYYHNGKRIGTWRGLPGYGTVYIRLNDGGTRIDRFQNGTFSNRNGRTFPAVPAHRGQYCG